MTPPNTTGCEIVVTREGIEASGESITIRIRMKGKLVTVKMTLNNFARAVTGLNAPCVVNEYVYQSARLKGG